MRRALEQKRHTKQTHPPPLTQAQHTTCAHAIHTHTQGCPGAGEEPCQGVTGRTQHTKNKCKTRRAARPTTPKLNPHLLRIVISAHVVFIKQQPASPLAQCWAACKPKQVFNIEVGKKGSGSGNAVRSWGAFCSVSQDMLRSFYFSVTGPGLRCDIAVTTCGSTDTHVHGYLQMLHCYPGAPCACLMNRNAR